MGRKKMVKKLNLLLREVFEDEKREPEKRLVCSCGNFRFKPFRGVPQGMMMCQHCGTLWVLETKWNAVGFHVDKRRRCLNEMSTTHDLAADDRLLSQCGLDGGYVTFNPQGNICSLPGRKNDDEVDGSGC